MKISIAKGRWDDKGPRPNDLTSYHLGTGLSLGGFHSTAMIRQRDDGDNAYGFHLGPDSLSHYSGIRTIQALREEGR